MIQSVSFEKTIYNTLPYKFEAGTPAIAQAIGLGAAIDYLLNIKLDAIYQHESALVEYALKELGSISSLKFIGTATHRGPVISFLLGNIHPHDVGTFLNEHGIAVRTGQHCAEPALRRLGVNSTIRASFGLYNTISEIERLGEALEKAKKLFQ